MRYKSTCETRAFVNLIVRAFASELPKLAQAIVSQ